MFGEPISRISSNLESLRDFVELLDAYLSEQKLQTLNLHAMGLSPLILAFAKIGVLTKEEIPGFPTQEKLTKMLKDRLKLDVDIEFVEEGDEKTAKINVRGEGHEKFIESMKAYTKVHSRLRLLYNSALMNLASIVELFFSELFHVYFLTHPEIIETKEKVFSLDDIRFFDTVADARQHYLNSRIESILYSSFADWIALIKEKAKLSMSYLESDLDLLNETFMRRNAIVHNGGLANTIYLSKIAKNLKNKISIGYPLNPDRKYLNERIDLFERNCILIAAELWKKLSPEDNKRSSVLIKIAYNHLKEQRWHIAEALSYFTMHDKKVPEIDQSIGKMNYWICKKRQGKWKEIETEVAAADFSAKSLKFQIALVALCEKYDEFYSIINRAISAEEISIDDLNEFPIFEDMRQDKRFEQYRIQDESMHEKATSTTKLNDDQTIPSVPGV